MAGSADVLGSLDADVQALCRRAWWVFLVSGIASVVFGVLAFVNPLVALFVLATFFAAYLLVDGVSNIVGSFQNRGKDGWWILLLIGILGTLVGGYALLNPPVSMLAFVYLVAFEALLLGAFLLMLGYKVRKATTREWILYLTGALSLVFGVLVLVNPAAGGVKIVYLIASWAIVVGMFKIAFAFKARNLRERLAPGAAT